MLTVNSPHKVWLTRCDQWRHGWSGGRQVETKETAAGGGGRQGEAHLETRSSTFFLEQIWSQLVRGGEGGLLQEEGEDNFQGPAVYGGASCLLQKCLSPVSSINFLLLVRICFEAAGSYQTKP